MSGKRTVATLGDSVDEQEKRLRTAETQLAALQSELAARTRELDLHKDLLLEMRGRLTKKAKDDAGQHVSCGLPLQVVAQREPATVTSPAQFSSNELAPTAATQPAHVHYEVPEILSWIGTDHIWFIAAPCFPFANGPVITPSTDGTVEVEWEWQPQDTQSPSPYRTLHSLNVLRAWGQQSKLAHTPGCKWRVRVPVPPSYSLRERANAIERDPNDTEVVYQFTTNRSPPSIPNPLVAPRIPAPERVHVEELTEPNVKHA